MGAPDIPSVEAREAARWVAAGRAVVVDVRQLHEWEAGRIPDAIHAVGAELESVLERWRGLDIVLVCRSGNRSGRLVAELIGRGYRVYNLRGGLRAWHGDGLPLDPPDGVVS